MRFLKFVLLWCYIWQYKQAYGLQPDDNSTIKGVFTQLTAEITTNNSTPEADVTQYTAEIPDEEDKLDFNDVLAEIRAGNENYTGTIITSNVLVVNGTVKTKSPLVCTVNGVNCTEVDKIDLDPNSNIAFVHIFENGSEPAVYEGHPSEAKECFAGGINHEPNQVLIDEDGRVTCESGCENFDAVICDNSLAGIITGEPNLVLTNVEELRAKIKYADSIQPNQIKDDEDESTEVDETYKGYLVRVRADGNEYTGTIITSQVVATSIKANNKYTSVCELDSDDCMQVERIDSVDGDGFALIHVNDYLPEPLPFSGNTEPTSCIAAGVNHDPVKLEIVENQVICEYDCEDFDAVVCDGQLMGVMPNILPHNTFISLEDLRSKISYPKEENLEQAKVLARQSNGVIHVIPHVVFIAFSVLLCYF